MIYLDNAATSWPKPPAVLRAMTDFLERAGANPGRSSHRLAIEAGRLVLAAREALAELFGVRDPLRIIFTSNVTHAINLALRGLVRAGDRVVTSGIEHNAVMRPLRAMEKDGLRLTVVPCAADGSLDPGDVTTVVTPGTRRLVVTHASNVVGTIVPIADLAQIAHEAGALLLVDAAQTAGAVPIDIQAMGIDLLAFTGHKGLYGPPGTGGLIIGERVDLGEFTPLVRGGTGSNSAYEEQPSDLPDKYESGTLNGPGIAGLGAGVRFVMGRGVEAIRTYEAGLTTLLLEGLAEVPGVRLYGPSDMARRTAVVSFTVRDRQVSDLAWRLDEEYGILSRVGLHCAPAAHRTIGTFPDGTVRFAPGVFTTADDIQATVRAVRTVIAS